MAKKSKKKAQERKTNLRLDADGLETEIMVPPRTVKAFENIEQIKKSFSLPVTMGTSAEEREKLDMAFDSAGGFDAIYGSLQQHAYDMGQYPVTSFIGYGALQQIAQNGMIRAAVQTVADDITRSWIEVTGGDDRSESVAELQDLQQSKYGLQKIFHEASTLTGFMGGAFIYIDTGADDLTLPLSINDYSAELDKGGTLRFVVVDPVNVTPGDYNCVNPLRSDYMQPKWWWVLGQQVHASRLIPLLDNPPPVLLKPSYNFLGIPQAQILWDYVLHWNQCRIYTADLVRKVSLLVFQTDMDAVFATPGGVRQFDIKMQALQRYRDNNSVFVCDKEGENVLNVQTSIAGCTDIVRQSLEMIAAINRTPAVKLLGISPSGFNATGESDIRNYYDYIKSKQELRRDALLRCLKAIQLVEYGYIDESISFEWKELGVDNEQTQATTAQARAGMLAQLAQLQAISAEEVRQAVREDPAMKLGFLSDELPEMDPEDMGGLPMPEMGGEKGSSETEPVNPPDEPRQLMQEAMS
nr:MAG TPA: portal [Caudoviricetes sp.]